MTCDIPLNPVSYDGRRWVSMSAAAVELLNDGSIESDEETQTQMRVAEKRI